MNDKLPSQPESRDNASLAVHCSCGAVLPGDAVAGAVCVACQAQPERVQEVVTQTISFCGDVGSGTSFHLTGGPDRSGEELGHFRLLHKLGHGGMGAVYQALDESLQRLVAVKVIRAAEDGGTSSSGQIGRLLNEAVAQARLNHPNVVTIYYVGRDGEEPFFAMELLPGPTLAALVHDGPLPYKDVISYARQVSAALAQASALGIVHGDIKPSNLILSDESTVKLGDFGLAQTESTSPDLGLSGTLSYMAPELANDGEPSAQSDMYSLGVTLFELTFGRRPYAVRGSTLREQITSQQGAEIAFPEKWPRTIPERWKHVLERLLAKDPDKRFPTYAALDAELKALTPVGVTGAGLLNRGLAWLFDLMLQAVLLSPFVLLVQMPRWVTAAYMPPLLAPVLGNLRSLALLAPIVPALFAYAEFRGWRTPGRYLFQLRVADEHGLRLNPRRRVLRSIVRNLPIWGLSLRATLVTLGLPEIAVLLVPVDELALLANIIPVLGPRRLAIHDRLFGSHVVLDTGSDD